MKSNPTVFIFVVAVIRLFAFGLLLWVASTAATLLNFQPAGAWWDMMLFALRATVPQVIGSIVLWFIARPVAKLILHDLNEYALGGSL
jgi:hypothetical protein